MTETISHSVYMSFIACHFRRLSYSSNFINLKLFKIVYNCNWDIRNDIKQCSLYGGFLLLLKIKH